MYHIMCVKLYDWKCSGDWGSQYFPWGLLFGQHWHRLWYSAFKSVFANYLHSSSHLIQSYWPVTYLAEPLVLNNLLQLDSKICWIRSTCVQGLDEPRAGLGQGPDRLVIGVPSNWYFLNSTSMGQGWQVFLRECAQVANNFQRNFFVHGNLSLLAPCFWQFHWCLSAPNMFILWVISWVARSLIQPWLRGSFYQINLSHLIYLNFKTHLRG